ncbi:MAG: phosphoenolpyruvate carboxylase [Haliangiales bacterium]
MLERLSEDIALLSGTLDEVVAEIAGDDALALVRSLRDDALALREGRLDGGREAFGDRLAALDRDQLALVARVFTLWFHLVNGAEEQHRTRVLRHRDTDRGAADSSLAAAARELATAGLSSDEVRALLQRLYVMPVLTAHPTEARRRTVLDHLGVIAGVLDKLDRATLGAREKQHVLDSLHDAIVALFGTEESRAVKPSPRDEVISSLDVFETTLLDVTPMMYRAFEEALRAAFPDEVFTIPPFLRWGTWIGGDRDGNPFVTSDTTRWVLEQQRLCVLKRYLSDVDDLMRALSVSERRVTDRAGLAELEASLATDRERMPEVRARAQRYTTHEPWREKLWYIRARLADTQTRGDASYANADRFLEDLTLLRDSLRATGFARLAEGVLHDTIRRAEVFGFHLASLDLRQHSAVHERAVDELLRLSGTTGYQYLDEDARVELLTRLLDHADFAPRINLSQLSPETRELLATLDMVGRARREQGPAACERYIVSFTSTPSDLLEVLYLQRASNLAPGELRPVPLLEQLEDLDRAAEMATAMLDIRPIRAALRGELEVMIGYSDAGKQIGYFAAAVTLRRAQQALAEVAEARGVPLTVFHGRGGAIGRGGGPSNRSIRAQPAKALRGRIRVTEQGETITARYGRPEIASRDLEQMVHAVLVAAADEKTPPSPEEISARNELLADAGEHARQAYSELLGDPDLLARYAVAATPIQQVTKLPIGSRPASRRPGLSFDDLRAIPWVFSWNQSRHGLPGWFGLGTALERMRERDGLEAVRTLYRVSPFVRALINNGQLALSRADIDVAGCYAKLADDEAQEVFARIKAEHERTVKHLLEVVEHQEILGNRPHLLGTIKRRNPSVDVLSHAQIELLRRLRRAEADDSGDDSAALRTELLAILFITINGIAAGLQTAG